MQSFIALVKVWKIFWFFADAWILKKGIMLIVAVSRALLCKVTTHYTRYC